MHRSQVLRGLIRGSAAALLSTVPTLAQSQLWIQQSGTSENDEAVAVAPDGSGGLFAAGTTGGDFAGPNLGRSDAWIARYDRTGSQLWIRQVGSLGMDFGSDVVPDGSGGAYLIGNTGGAVSGPLAGDSECWLARYDHDGNLLWREMFGSSAQDSATAGAQDGSGGVYVTGSTTGSFGGPAMGQLDAWIARFDGTGNQIWVRQLGSVKSDASLAAASDDSGGVYVTGWSAGDLGGFNLGYVDAWLARYDPSGNQLWVRKLGTDNGEVSHFAAADSSGGVYVGGVTGGSLGGPNAGASDAWFARFNASGQKLWVRQFGTSEDDQAYGAWPDSAGGVYLCGATQGSLGGASAGLADAWLGRFDGAGLQLWMNQFGSSGKEGASTLAPDASGGLFVGGKTNGALGGSNAGSDDAWLARYDGSCNSGTTYCVASSTSLPGCTASLTATGSPTLSNPTAWTVSSGPVPGGNLGLLLLGSSGKDNTPYGTLGGQLCVASPTFRTAPKSSRGDQGQCNGGYAFTLQDLISAAPVVTSGATINAQVWARDPANVDGFLLSDGLEVVVCP